MDVRPAVGRLEADVQQARRERDQLRAENDEFRTQLARKRAEVEDLEKQVDDAAHAAIEDKKEIRGWKRKAEDAEAAARKEKETMEREMEEMRRKMTSMEDELRRLQSQGMGARKSTVSGVKDSPIHISDREDTPVKAERQSTSSQSAVSASPAATVPQASQSASTTRTSLQKTKTHSKIPAPPIEISDDEAASVVKRESSKTESMDTESLFSPIMSPAPSSGRSESISRASRRAGTKRRRPTESDADDSDAPPVASTSSGRPKRARASVNYRDSVSPAPSESLSVMGRASPVPALPTTRKKPIAAKPLPKSRSKPGTSRIPTFPAWFLDKYLRSLPAFHISPTPDPTLVGPRASIHPAFGGQYAQLVTELTSVPRRYMSAGGGSLTTTTTVFPQHDWNPLLPVAPGAPGLLFASREDVADEGKVYRIFVRVKEETKSIWRYMGEYRLARAGVVPAEVWQGQTDAVKKRWAEHIRDTKKGVYAEMYANVSAAKAQESDEALVLQDIIDALCRGDKDAAIGIIQMRCVRYDHSFATHLRYAIDHPPPKKAKA